MTGPTTTANPATGDDDPEVNIQTTPHSAFQLWRDILIDVGVMWRCRSFFGGVLLGVVARVSLGWGCRSLTVARAFASMVFVWPVQARRPGVGATSRPSPLLGNPRPPPSPPPPLEVVGAEMGSEVGSEVISRTTSRRTRRDGWPSECPSAWYFASVPAAGGGSSKDPTRGLGTSIARIPTPSRAMMLTPAASSTVELIGCLVPFKENLSWDCPDPHFQVTSYCTSAISENKLNADRDVSYLS